MLQATPIAKKLPGLIEIKHLFTLLFDPDTACTTRKIALPTEECAIVSVYLDKDRAIKRLLACDLAFANSAGSALTALPAAAANKATQSARMADNVFDNVSEVMNIAVNLFTESFGDRLELAAVARLQDLTPEALTALASIQRVKIDVSIPRYDRGRFDLIAI